MAIPNPHANPHANPHPPAPASATAAPPPPPYLSPVLTSTIDFGKKLGDVNKRITEFGKVADRTGKELGGVGTALGMLGIPTGVGALVSFGMSMQRSAYQNMMASAAIANPMAAGTHAASEKMFEAVAGRRNVGMMNNQSATQQRIAMQLAESPREYDIPGPTTIPGTGMPSPNVMASLFLTRREQGMSDKEKQQQRGFMSGLLASTFGIGMADVKPPLQSFAGLGGGEQFANMAEWSAAQQRASLAQGPAEEFTLRQQRKNMMEDMGRTGGLLVGGAGPAEATPGEKTDALTQAIADLAGKVASLQMWGR